MGSGRHRDWVIGYLFGLSFPKKHFAEFGQGGREAFFILTLKNWQVMASHGNIFIIFIAKNGMIFHDLSM